MKTKYHYSCIYRYELQRLLEQNNVKYETSSFPFLKKGSYLTFDLYEEDAAFKEIAKEIDSTELCFRQIEYLEEDLLNAEWLTVRCSNASIDLAREDSIFRCYDGCHHREISGSTFYLNKPVRWGNKHFVASYDLGVEYLFCDERARNILEKRNIPVHFEPILHSRTGAKMEDVYYLNICDVLPEESIIFRGEENRVICPTCGRIRYGIGGDYQLCIRKDALVNCNTICKTACIFALGQYYFTPLNLVSQALYRDLKMNQLIRNLTIEPVIIG